jgi:hypothetical protein
VTAVVDRHTITLGATLDPETVKITRHALERYTERRHGASYVLAEAKIRKLLGRCSTQSPPVQVRPEGATRRYRCGSFVFIVSADCSTVITMWRNR